MQVNEGQLKQRDGVLYCGWGGVSRVRLPPENLGGPPDDVPLILKRQQAQRGVQWRETDGVHPFLSRRPAAERPHQVERHPLVERRAIRLLLVAVSRAAQELLDLGSDARLFPDLALRRVLRRLAVPQLALGQAPLGGAAAMDEEDFNPAGAATPHDAARRSQFNGRVRSLHGWLSVPE